MSVCSENSLFQGWCC